MSSDGTNNDGSARPIASGSEIVANFIDSLHDDLTLDPTTVAVIQSLYRERKLSVTNLLNRLEEARGKSNV